MLRLSANISIMFPELPFRERFGAARRAGFEAVECWFPYDIPVSELRAILDGEGLRLIGINTEPGDISRGEWGLTGLPGREAAFRDGVSRALDYATSLSVNAVHVMAATAPPGIQPTELWPRYCDAVAEAAARFAGTGVTMLIEPLNVRDRPGYLLSRSDQAAALIRDIGVDHLRLMFDVYHVQISEGDILRRIEAHWDVIGHFQIAAVPTRHEPDEGELNYRAILSAIAARGWQGWIGCEYRPLTTTEAGLGWRKALGV